jgi:hypothetical protein
LEGDEPKVKKHFGKLLQRAQAIARVTAQLSCDVFPENNRNQQ